MEQHKIIVTRIVPTEIEIYYSCQQCGKGMSNKDESWQMIFQWWNDFSVESIQTGKLTLASQGVINICDGCYGALKEYFDWLD